MLHTVGTPDAKPRHELCEGAQEPLRGPAAAGRLGGEAVSAEGVNKGRGGKNRWHGDTPCPRMRAHQLWEAASCGASSTQALAQRRGRDSPQSSFLKKVSAMSLQK